MSDQRFTDEQAIEQLKDLIRRREDLSRRVTQANTRLEQAQEEYRRLQAEAVERFGTSDPDALERELEARRERNAKAIEDFRAGLDQAEESVAKLENLLRA